MMRSRLFAVLTLTLALPASASITGTVMTREGQAVAGARVAVYSPETIEMRRARLISDKPEPTPLSTTSSNSSGAFTLESPKDAVVTLRVEAKGFAPQSEEIERDEENVVFALSPAATKQGTITAGGKAVAGARVIFTFGNTEWTATTDPSGHYTVPDPAKWAGRILVRHGDFAGVEQVTGARRQLDLDHALDAGVAIKGRVTSGDGKTPVAKATLVIDGWPAGVSSEDGTFTVEHAPKKWETIEAQLDDRTASHSRAGKSEMTLRLAPSASVAGTLRDSKQVPVAGAIINVSPAPAGMGRQFRASPIASVVTDSKGAFNVTGIPTGAYQITVNHPAFSTPNTQLSLVAGQRAQKALAANRRARITGTVVDEEKKPVAAATLVADTVSRERGGGGFMPRNLARMMMPGRGPFSGPDGRFLIRSDTTDGDVEIEATRKGYPPGKSTALHLTSGERKSGVVITVPRGMALTGRVSDPGGKPLSGVTVMTSEAEGGQMPGMVRRMVMIGVRGNNDEDEVKTGSDGTFSTRVKEGTYDVVFKREGFSTKTVRGIAVSATTKPVEVALDPGVEITGRVVRGGTGVEGVNVNVASMESQASTTTGPDGRFSLGDLTAGSYMVMFNKQDDFVQQMRNLTAPARDITIDLPPGGRVSGRVLDKNTHQPITSFQAGVNLSRSGGAMQIQLPPMMKSFTSDDGSFVLDGVPVGTTSITASAPGYMTARATNITVEEGKTVSDVELQLETGVRLTGHVTAPDGTPLSGVAVRQDTGGGGAAMRMVMNFGGDSTTVTDANGEYAIEQLETGEKTFQFSHDGYLSTSKTVQLSGRESRLDAQLSAGARVTGTVVTDAGAPVPDADIRANSAVSGGAGFRSTRTDGNGGFSFDGLAPGHYTFTASKNGFADGSVRDFDISAGAPLRIALKTGGVLYGHVTGVGAADLGHVTVTVRGSNGNAEAPVDGSGSYRIEGTPTGSLRVAGELMRSFSDSRESAVKMVDVAAGASVQVDIEFDSSTTVTGRITRNGSPLTGSSVAFIPLSGGTRVQVGTDESGSYTANGLSDGKYSVLVIDTQRMNPYTTSYEVHGSSTFDIDMKTTSLKGRVTEAGSGDPVDKVRVQLVSKDVTAVMSARGATTDENGAFTIDSVSPGQYTVTAEKDGYGNAVRDVSVADSGAPLVELSIAKNDGVILKVVDARDGQSLNPTVVVYDSANRSVYQSTFRGTSEKLPLPPGDYRAVIAAMGYAPRTVTFTSPSTQTVPLTPGGGISVRAKTSDTARRARLIDSSGLVYARPMSFDSSYPIAGTVSAINNIAPGTYTLEVTSGGAFITRVTVVVVEGQVATVDI